MLYAIWHMTYISKVYNNSADLEIPFPVTVNCALKIVCGKKENSFE